MKEFSAIDKAAILVEALPYIKKFHGKTVVIKYGGNAMINEDLKDAVLKDIVLMQLVGMRPVVIHGGGPDINSMLDKLHIQSEFINGQRVTDEAAMQVVEMVLTGKVNSDIVKHLNQNGGEAVGLCGSDANLLVAHKKITTVQNEDGSTRNVDLGLVGEVESVNVDLLNSLLEQGYIPVISPVASGRKGESYNVNADLAAGAVAAALKAEKLVLLTDVEGLYRDYKDKSSLISVLPTRMVDSLKEQGVIAGGMIPKIDCCVHAVKQGVGSVHILDGRVLHCILLEIFTREGIGTMVVNK
jgi:acetylglutamate kinase